MSSAKTERLVNLTMALLGSKRYMTKSEIFRRVAGYTGSNETKERMFERDKDDLRQLGIEIEVASHDPLFEDEVGYRIRSEVFQIRENFDAEELGLISLALNLIKDSDLQEVTPSLMRRLNSLSVSPVMPDGIRLFEQEISEEGLFDLLTAMSARRTVKFFYRKDPAADLEERRVNPLGVSAWRGSWYLAGEDLDRDDVRVFKVSRIASSIEFLSSPNTYVIPSDFDIKEYLIMLRPAEYKTKLQLRNAAGLHLRNLSDRVKAINADWDLVEVSFQNLTEAQREILWLGPDVVVLEPLELRESVTEALTRIVTSHG